MTLKTILSSRAKPVLLVVALHFGINGSDYIPIAKEIRKTDQSEKNYVAQF